MSARDHRTVLQRGRPVMVQVDSEGEAWVSVVLLNGHGERVADEFSAEDLRELADALGEVES